MPPFWRGNPYRPHEGVPCPANPDPHLTGTQASFSAPGQCGPASLYPGPQTGRASSWGQPWLPCKPATASWTPAPPAQPTEAESLRASGAPSPAARLGSLPPHTPRAPGPGGGDRQGSWGGNDCRLHSWQGVPRLTSLAPILHTLPQLSDSRCVYWVGGVIMVLNLCEICSWAPSSGLSRGLHSTNTLSAASGPQDDWARGRARTGSSQEGQGSRPYESWAETREAFLPFTPPPRSPGAGWGPAQPCQLPARGGPHLRAKALQGGSIWLGEPVPAGGRVALGPGPGRSGLWLLGESSELVQSLVVSGAPIQPHANPTERELLGECVFSGKLEVRVNRHSCCIQSARRPACWALSPGARSEAGPRLGTDPPSPPVSVKTALMRQKHPSVVPPTEKPQEPTAPRLRVGRRASPFLVQSVMGGEWGGAGEAGSWRPSELC